MANYEDIEQDLKNFGKNLEGTKFPEKCAHCGADNTTQASSCFNCEEEFEPIEEENGEFGDDDEDETAGGKGTENNSGSVENII